MLLDLWKTHSSEPFVSESKLINMEVLEVTVSFEDDAESIIEKLTSRNKELDIISIYGMPGLGKTTLARKVYNDRNIVSHFDVRAWCSISRRYNVTELLLEIFKQVDGNKCEVKEDDNVADMLRRSLMGKRYLIVLDDIWDVEAWEELQPSFPVGDNKCRIMLTTRSELVAREIQHHSDPYSLRFFTVEESWELLQKKVFQNENCPPELKAVGLQVAQKCKGLPLVVVLVAGIIAKKERQASSWLDVANGLSSHVSMVEEEQSMKVIQSSYDHLEDHLKPCLIYMGLFPEDYEFEAHYLLKFWIAEGIVQNIDWERMEDASKGCLIDLVNSSLVMVYRMSGIEYYMVHDLVRDFCLRKIKEENFMQLIVPYDPYEPSNLRKPRSCIYIHDQLAKESEGVERDRSLEFIAHPEFYTSECTNIFTLLDNFRIIRVLHYLSNANLQGSWATALQPLTHLRYLAITAKEFDFKWVSHLRHLETLVVRSSDIITTSPPIWKMDKLRYLEISPGFNCRWEENDVTIYRESSEIMLENLKSLGRCLTSMSDLNPELWWRLSNLEELNILIAKSSNDRSCYCLFPGPEIHTRLQSLDVGYQYSIGWACNFVFPSNLKKLELRAIYMTESVVSNIAGLRNLEILVLRIFDFPGHCKVWDIGGNQFRALKHLWLWYSDMIEWRCSEAASFPVLETLLIGHCMGLKEIPSSFVDIPTLQLIKVRRSSESVGASALKIKEEVEENSGCDSLQVHFMK